jgi:hypothetical protein
MSELVLQVIEPTQTHTEPPLTHAPRPSSQAMSELVLQVTGARGALLAGHSQPGARGAWLSQALAEHCSMRHPDRAREQPGLGVRRGFAQSSVKLRHWPAMACAKGLRRAASMRHPDRARERLAVDPAQEPIARLGRAARFRAEQRETPALASNGVCEGTATRSLTAC